MSESAPRRPSRWSRREGRVIRYWAHAAIHSAIASGAGLNPTWIRHALYGLILRGCEQAMAGALPRHTIAPLITRTFERGICPAP
jgi:hypothetical protein